MPPEILKCCHKYLRRLQNHPTCLPESGSLGVYSNSLSPLTSQTPSTPSCIVQVAQVSLPSASRRNQAIPISPTIASSSGQTCSRSPATLQSIIQPPETPTRPSSRILAPQESPGPASSSTQALGVPPVTPTKVIFCFHNTMTDVIATLDKLINPYTSFLAFLVMKHSEQMHLKKKKVYFSLSFLH